MSCTKPGCTSSALRTAPPTSGWASSTRTDQPRSARRFAATRPLGPAPTTTASWVTPRGARRGRPAVAGTRRCASPAAGPARRSAPPRPDRTSPAPRCVTSVSVPTGESRMVTVARPTGQARACRVSIEPGWLSTTSVVSSSSSGHEPTEWWRREPGGGPGVVDLAHPGGADDPEGVEPAVGEDRPHLVGGGRDDAAVGAHANPYPCGHPGNGLTGFGGNRPAERSPGSRAAR